MARNNSALASLVLVSCVLLVHLVHCESVRVVKVVRVLAGDLFVYRSAAGEETSARLAHIDAPERGEPGAASATAFLKKRVQGRLVDIETVGADAAGLELV